MMPSLFSFCTIVFCNLVLKANKYTNLPALELCQEKHYTISLHFAEKENNLKKTSKFYRSAGQ